MRNFVKANSHGLLVIVGFLLVAAALAAQVSFNKHILQRLENENMSMKILLTDAIKNLNRPAVVDGPSRKVYVPDARVVLPPYNKNIQDILYNYAPADGDKFPEELQLTTKVAQQSGLNDIFNVAPGQVFSRVPHAQACSRQIIMTFNSKEGSYMSSDNYREVHSKTLTDGRKLRTYVTNGCLYNADELMAFVRDIQSY